MKVLYSIKLIWWYVSDCMRLVSEMFVYKNIIDHMEFIVQFESKDYLVPTNKDPDQRSGLAILMAEYSVMIPVGIVVFNLILTTICIIVSKIFFHI